MSRNFHDPTSHHEIDSFTTVHSVNPNYQNYEMRVRQNVNLKKSFSNEELLNKQRQRVNVPKLHISTQQQQLQHTNTHTMFQQPITQQKYHSQQQIHTQPHTQTQPIMYSTQSCHNLFSNNNNPNQTQTHTQTHTQSQMNNNNNRTYRSMIGSPISVGNTVDGMSPIYGYGHLYTSSQSQTLQSFPEVHSPYGSNSIVTTGNNNNGFPLSYTNTINNGYESAPNNYSNRIINRHNKSNTNYSIYSSNSNTNINNTSNTNYMYNKTNIRPNFMDSIHQSIPPRSPSNNGPNLYPNSPIGSSHGNIPSYMPFQTYVMSSRSHMHINHTQPQTQTQTQTHTHTQIPKQLQNRVRSQTVTLPNNYSSMPSHMNNSNTQNQLMEHRISNTSYDSNSTFPKDSISVTNNNRSKIHKRGLTLDLLQKHDELTSKPQLNVLGFSSDVSTERKDDYNYNTGEVSYTSEGLSNNNITTNNELSPLDESDSLSNDESKSSSDISIEFNTKSKRQNIN